MNVEIMPILIAPDCPMANLYSNWLRTLPEELSATALPILIMAPSVYAKDLGYAQTEVGTATACIDFAQEFEHYGHPLQMSRVTSDRTDLRPVTAPPTSTTGMSSNAASSRQT